MNTQIRKDIEEQIHELKIRWCIRPDTKTWWEEEIWRTWLLALEDELKFLESLISNTTIRESTWVLLMIKPRISQLKQDIEELKESLK
jgi:hypothetical protein